MSTSSTNIHRELTYDMFNLLFAEASVGAKEMLFDFFEKQIDKSIEKIKADCINAHISNLALNIAGELVLAQLYVERKNGFTHNTDPRFGTNPTAFNVQVRFPFGLKMHLGKEEVLLPDGDFHHPLQPVLSGTKTPKVLDDVRRDYKKQDIILGEGVTCKGFSQAVLECTDSNSKLVLPVSDITGAGYYALPGTGTGSGVKLESVHEYHDIRDYLLRLKVAGIYPLFYSDRSLGSDGKLCGLLRVHPEYPGYSFDQYADKKEDRIQAQKNLDAYKSYIQRMENSITETPIGKEWKQRAEARATSQPWVFDIQIINGTKLYSQTGLPVTRLRAYQLELFDRCIEFVNHAKESGSHNVLQKGHAGIIDMGVGAGKTFITFSLLQYITHSMKNSGQPVCPPWCMAPDLAVAQVSERAINKQGMNSAISATAICGKEQLPDASFMVNYASITDVAAREAESIDHYLNYGLQEEIRRFCNEKNLHPNVLVDIIFNVRSNGSQKSRLEWDQRISTFKNSIDSKRLLLMVEGQKNIKEQTGSSALSALKALHEQFQMICTAIEEQKEKKDEPLFRDYFYGTDHYSATPRADIDYSALVDVPRSCINPSLPRKLQVTTITSLQMKSLISHRHQYNKVAIRDSLIAIAAFDSHEASILLANSGGLGNTCTPDVINRQIEELLPLAHRQLITLANKPDKTLKEHCRLYISLGQIFSTIPDKINFGSNSKNGLYREFLADHVDLVNHIERALAEKIARLTSVESLGIDQQVLANFDLSPGTSAIEAANKLAGAASLQVTGFALDVDMLLSHIPIFTPEGLACYFEHLAELIGQTKYDFASTHGIFQANSSGVVTQEDIIHRLTQVLGAVMVADEIHKDEFACLYDESNPIYQRISKVTEHLLGKPFREVLPNRIGMSGTINAVAKKAFKGETLFQLPIQRMIQQGQVKQVFVDRFVPEAEDITKFAEQIVVDYFAEANSLSDVSVSQGRKNISTDLYALSKGLLFSKKPNKQLHTEIESVFNLLINPEASPKQKELLDRINTKRQERAQIPLLETSRESIQQAQRQSWQNTLFAIYLEYILSKSNTPKEFSDLVSFQNRLFEQGYHLTDLVDWEKLSGHSEMASEVASLLASVNSVDPQNISIHDVQKFMQERIKSDHARTLIIDLIMSAKNNWQTVIRDLQEVRGESASLLTRERADLETGFALAMLAGERERTGYSWETVGIVMDIPDDPSLLNAPLFTAPVNSENIAHLLQRLQKLVTHTLSYDEKNQAGGRALRTPDGRVRYVEYLSEFSRLITLNDNFAAWQVETRFDHIFTHNEEHAALTRASVTFNREALRLLKSEFTCIEDYFQAVANRFKKELRNDQDSQRFTSFINSRLPLLWDMKHNPQGVADWIPVSIQQPYPTPVVQWQIPEKKVKVVASSHVASSSSPAIPGLDKILDTHRSKLPGRPNAAPELHSPGVKEVTGMGGYYQKILVELQTKANEYSQLLRHFNNDYIQANTIKAAADALNVFQNETMKFVSFLEDHLDDFEAGNARDLYCLPELPENTEPYKNSYVYINNDDTQSLYYIMPNGEAEDVLVFDFQRLEKAISDINRNSENKLRLNQSQINKIITSNGGHNPGNTTIKAIETLLTILKKNKSALSIRSCFKFNLQEADIKLSSVANQQFPAGPTTPGDRFIWLMRPSRAPGEFTIAFIDWLASENKWQASKNIRVSFNEEGEFANKAIDMILNEGIQLIPNVSEGIATHLNGILTEVDKAAKDCLSSSESLIEEASKELDSLNNRFKISTALNSSLSSDSNQNFLEMIPPVNKEYSVEDEHLIKEAASFIEDNQAKYSAIEKTILDFSNKLSTFIQSVTNSMVTSSETMLGLYSDIYKFARYLESQSDLLTGKESSEEHAKALKNLNTVMELFDKIHGMIARKDCYTYNITPQDERQKIVDATIRYPEGPKDPDKPYLWLVRPGTQGGLTAVFVKWDADQLEWQTSSIKKVQFTDAEGNKVNNDLTDELIRNGVQLIPTDTNDFPREYVHAFRELHEAAAACISCLNALRLTGGKQLNKHKTEVSSALLGRFGLFAPARPKVEDTRPEQDQSQSSSYPPKSSA